MAAPTATSASSSSIGQVPRPSRGISRPSFSTIVGAGVTVARAHQTRRASTGPRRATTSPASHPGARPPAGAHCLDPDAAPHAQWRVRPSRRRGARAPASARGRAPPRPGGRAEPSRPRDRPRVPGVVAPAAHPVNRTARTRTTPPPRGRRPARPRGSASSSFTSARRGPQRLRTSSAPASGRPGARTSLPRTLTIASSAAPGRACGRVLWRWTATAVAADTPSEGGRLCGVTSRSGSPSSPRPGATAWGPSTGIAVDRSAHDKPPNFPAGEATTGTAPIRGGGSARRLVHRRPASPFREPPVGLRPRG